MIALATKLEEELESGGVDGHDVGGGIVNIFIDTVEPRQCFKEAMRIISGLEPKPHAAGYRGTMKKNISSGFGPRTILHRLN